MPGYIPEGLRGLEQDDCDFPAQDGPAGSAGDTGQTVQNSGATKTRLAAPRRPASAGAGSQGGRPASSSGRSKGLGLRGWTRWIWRQLTSMRVALLLLLLLTVVAMPGAFFPQRRVDPRLVTQFFEDNPTLAP